MKKKQELDEKIENLFEENLLDEKIDKFFDDDPSDEEIDEFFEENPKEKERFLEDDNSKGYVVSEEFKEIYHQFNVSNQTERMKQLTEKELYMLLICCIDHHDEEQEIVFLNFLPFEEEINEILKFSDTEKTENSILKSLIEETGDETISTSGINLPEVLSKQEALSLNREQKIGKILDN